MWNYWESGLRRICFIGRMFEQSLKGRNILKFYRDVVMLSYEASHRNHSFNILHVLKRNVSGLDNAGCEMKSGHLIIAGFNRLYIKCRVSKNSGSIEMLRTSA